MPLGRGQGGRGERLRADGIPIGDVRVRRTVVAAAAATTTAMAETGSAKPTTDVASSAEPANQASLDRLAPLTSRRLVGS